MSERPGVMFYWDMFDVLENLLDGEAKTMLIAIRDYSRYSQIPDFGDNRVLATLWMLIRPKIDSDAKKYQDICVKRAEAGKKSAEQRTKLKGQKEPSVDTCSSLSSDGNNFNQKQIQIQPQSQIHIQKEKESVFDIRKEFSKWTV